jgi:hypothetical protein
MSDLNGHNYIAAVKMLGAIAGQLGSDISTCGKWGPFAKYEVLTEIG